ncbi:hypothetical protein [Alteribacillus sp. YIM 98480]|uniref:hypothetical protein n=1 Tax=Alteribacillus sp. YIM 98480 TaxID=2606599 RepID=UPI00131B13AE|nr:hypothetical protein [Alteribacillus sp. YIM 98480]
MANKLEKDVPVQEDENVDLLIKEHTYLLPRTKLGWVLSTIVFFAFLMVYPGLMVFNIAEPFILGMPFSYVWLTFWVHVIMAAGIIAAKKLWV